MRWRDLKVSGRAEIRRQHAGVDSRASEGGGPAIVDVAGVEELVLGGRGDPAVAAKLLLELAALPAGIAQSGEPARWAAALGDGAQYVEGGGERPAIADLDAFLPAPVRR